MTRYAVAIGALLTCGACVVASITAPDLCTAAAHALAAGASLTLALALLEIEQ